MQHIFLRTAENLHQMVCLSSWSQFCESGCRRPGGLVDASTLNKCLESLCLGVSQQQSSPFPNYRLTFLKPPPPPSHREASRGMGMSMILGEQSNVFHNGKIVRASWDDYLPPDTCRQSLPLALLGSSVASGRAVRWYTHEETTFNTIMSGKPLFFMWKGSGNVNSPRVLIHHSAIYELCCCFPTRGKTCSHKERQTPVLGDYGNMEQ
ncbi:hypothetical protein EDC04DRAFT_2101077 [Pisolithus marmoratus]|nr:hypothetical protein EDC04DRAFT_2101077 [Pisolithus marmoratus]